MKNCSAAITASRCRSNQRALASIVAATLPGRSSKERRKRAYSASSIRPSARPASTKHMSSSSRAMVCPLVVAMATSCPPGLGRTTSHSRASTPSGMRVVQITAAPAARAARAASTWPREWPDSAGHTSRTSSGAYTSGIRRLPWRLKYADGTALASAPSRFPAASMRAQPTYQGEPFPVKKTRLMRRFCTSSTKGAVSSSRCSTRKRSSSGCSRISSIIARAGSVTDIRPPLLAAFLSKGREMRHPPGEGVSFGVTERPSIPRRPKAAGSPRPDGWSSCPRA